MLALEAFEAVARLGSTTRAAGELGRTQSAVSRQVILLEKYLGRTLFERGGSRLTLNDAGQFLAAAVTRSLDQLERAVAKTLHFSGSRRRVTLRVWPTFAARWLVQRLAVFPTELGLEMELTMGLDNQLFDLRSSGIDAAILYGSGDWDDMVSSFLVPEQLIAVVSPERLKTLGPDIESHEWLYLEPRPRAWAVWMSARGPQDAPLKAGQRYPISVLVELACLGQGVAVVPSVYVEKELASGALVAPFGPPLKTGLGYYLCCLPEDANAREFVAFRDWLVSTCDEGVTAPEGSYPPLAVPV